MATVRVSVTGITDLEVMASALRHRATDAVEHDLHRLVPKDTFELDRSIVAHYGEGDTDTITIGTDHWSYPEFGVRSNPRYPRQPYIRPALFRERDLGAL